MKPRLYLVALISVVIASLACSLPWNSALQTSPPVDRQVNTATVPELVTNTDVVEPEAQPEETAQETFTCSPDMVSATAFSVEFCYPGQYSSGFSQVIMAENPPDGERPIWGINPDTIEITLAGYPINNEYHEPIVRIYPVDDFVALEPRIQSLVTELEALLVSGATNPPSVPFVPIFNAAQMIQAQVTHLGFRNGKGVRFITQYSQAAVPISNDNAFYAFIGLTDDGAYLISATMPVNHPLFYSDMFTEPAEGWATFSENFETYISNIETELLTQPPDSFYPVLSALDEMMAAFLIPPDAMP